MITWKVTITRLQLTIIKHATEELLINYLGKNATGLYSIQLCTIYFWDQNGLTKGLEHASWEILEAEVHTS